MSERSSQKIVNKQEANHFSRHCSHLHNAMVSYEAHPHRRVALSKSIRFHSDKIVNNKSEIDFGLVNKGRNLVSQAEGLLANK